MDSHKIKVLLCSPSPEQTGGIAMWTRTIVNNFYPNNHIPIRLVLCAMNRSAFVNYNTNYFTRIYRGVLDYVLILFRFTKLLIVEKPLIVHINTSGSIGFIKDILVSLISRLIGVKVIIHFHFGRIPYLKKYSFEYTLLKFVDILVNHYIVLDLNSLNSLRTLTKKPVSFVPNPLSEDFINAVDLNENIIEKEMCRLLFVGHVIPTKGVEELIDSFLTLEGFTLKVAGKIDEGYFGYLNDKYNSNSRYERVIFLGEVGLDELVSLYLESAIFILPSYTEGFPNVVIEALYSGCCVISTNVGAIPYITQADSSNPLATLINPRNANEISEAINEVCIKMNFSSHKLGSVRKNIVNRFSASLVVEELSEIYSKY